MPEIEKSYKYLKFSSLVETKFWDYYTLSHKDVIFSNFQLVKLKEVIKLRKEFINISEEIIYKRCRVQTQGKGIVLRDEVLGKEIKTKKQQVCKEDDFLVAEIDAKVGGFGIVPIELEGAIVSGHYFLFEIDKTKLLPEFLGIVVKQQNFSKQVKSTGSTNYAAIRPYQVLEYKIPLPDIAEQEKIIDAYNNRIEETVTLQKQAGNLEEEIEKYFFEALDIIESKKRRSSKVLNVVPFDSIDKWGVEYILDSNSDNLLKSRKYQNIKLGHVVEINPTTKMPKIDMNISFIPMECISDEYGEVIELRKKKISESKGYTKFQEGDLIWARITPCMQNGKSAIVKNLENNLGCGSTEFHVVRNLSKEIDLYYIYLILRLKPVLHNAMSHFTGSAGQQRVPKSFLENLEIPLPPLNKQQEIVKKLFSIKEQIKTLNTSAAELKVLAETDFETAIFK